jgi:tetratricopeptide (TPR) repeat protein
MSGNQSEFQRTMNLGHSAAWEQNWEQAATHYQTALEEFPNDTKALTSLGLALFELEDYNGALRCYQRSASIAPEDPVPYENMTRIFERTGKIDEAIKAGLQAAELQLRAHEVEKSIQSWVHVISLQPDNLNARTRLAMIYDRMGRKEQAALEYLAAASLMQQNGEKEKAVQAVRYCHQIAPNLEEVQKAMQLVRSNQPLPQPTAPQESFEKARAKLESIQPQASSSTVILQQDPIAESRQKALVELAGLLFDQSDEANPRIPTGRRNINQLTRGTGGLSLEQADRARILLHLGQAIDAQTQGDEKAAMENLERVLEIGLQKSAVYFDLGMLQSKTAPDKALSNLQNALRRTDYALGSHLLIGQIHEKAGRLNEASISYLQAFRLADALTVPEEHAEEMRQLYEPILEAQSHEHDEKALKSVCESITEILIRPDWRDRLTKARKQLDLQVENGPNLPLTEMLLETSSSQIVESLSQVRALANQNMPRSAMEEAYFALDFAPSYLPLHNQIGELLVQEGRLQEAIEKFSLIARLYTIRGESGQAIRVLQRVGKIAPMDQNVRSNLIELLVANERIDEAIQQYMDLGDIYYRLTELDLSRQAYLSALRLAQQSKTNRKWAVNILTKVADIDMQRLDWRQALRIFEQLRTIQPEDPQPRSQIIDINFRLANDTAGLNELDGYIEYLETNQKQEEAMNFILTLLAERPDKVEVRLRLVDLYTRMDEKEKAVQQLDSMADLLLERGDKAGAMNMLQRIIKLNPTNVIDYEAALNKLRYQ